MGKTNNWRRSQRLEIFRGQICPGDSKSYLTPLAGVDHPDPLNYLRGLRTKNTKNILLYFKGPTVLQVFKNLYKSWKDIDLYLAALLEKVPTDVNGQRNQES